MKFTNDCYDAMVREAREAVNREKPFAAEHLKQLLEDGNDWMPMPAEKFAGLETAYQRYVRQR
jgi:hypothetical protein